jgi:hypothetical protein
VQSVSAIDPKGSLDLHQCGSLLPFGGFGRVARVAHRVIRFMLFFPQLVELQIAVSVVQAKPRLISRGNVATGGGCIK